MHGIRLTSFFIAAIAATTLSACSKQEPASGTAATSSADRVVKIGFAAPLTGPQAHYGEDYQRGVLLALEDVNASKPSIGGQAVKFEIDSQDDQADPKTATQIAQKLVDNKTSGIIGHFNSGTSIPASKVYADAGIPMIAMATSPAYTTQGFKNTFRSMTSDTQQGSVMGRFVVDKLRAQRIVIIDDRTAYGQGLADEFAKAVQAAGGQILKREFTNDKASDFAAILTALKAVNPDVIFYGGADAQSAPMAKQMKRLGMAATLVSGEMTKTPTFLQLAGKDAEGSIASLPGLPLQKMPKGKDYESRYKARFKENVATYSPYSYDATRALIQAMQEVGSTDPKAYLSRLANIHHAGVTTDNWSYDAKGNLQDSGITVYKVVDGKWVVLETLGGISGSAASTAQ
ncbi:branched-chain amino acid ABC transporter substrate-binding protein [Neisseriaceae bacterium TC5R-5]|nr:branched-chain amino acid ABC transporter substrate-binding protein [Neisseriaceae bacterium TC5R-5]